ncbi:MAG: hypothetical protein ACLP51_00965 [Syntrophobacteraceae bacterium]
MEFGSGRLFIALSIAAIIGAIWEQWVVETTVLTKRRERRNLTHSALVVLVSGGLSSVQVFLYYYGSITLALAMAFQIGVFLSSLLQEIERPSEPTQPSAARSSVVGGAPVGTALILDGFWPVYGVGCFGALLVELYELYEKRARLPNRHWSYWAISVAMIFASGGVVVLYGTTNVHAVIAAQLGATAPLIIKRWRNGPVGGQPNETG